MSEWPQVCSGGRDVFEWSVGSTGAGAIGDANARPYRVHDDQGRSPILPGLGEQDPKQSIARAEVRTPDRAPENKR